MCSVLHAEKAVEAFILKGHLAEKEVIVLDIPRIFTITESEHRIHNPYTSSKLATLGAALRLKPITQPPMNDFRVSCGTI